MGLEWGFYQRKGLWSDLTGRWLTGWFGLWLLARLAWSSTRRPTHFSSIASAPWIATGIQASIPTIGIRRPDDSSSFYVNDTRRGEDLEIHANAIITSSAKKVKIFRAKVE